MIGETAEGLDHLSFLCDVPNRAEEAQDYVVSSSEVEPAHVRKGELARRHLEPRYFDKGRLEVDPINRESCRQQPRMFARTAADVEDGTSVRMLPLDERSNALGFSRVVLEGIDQVVVFGCLGEHVTLPAA